MCLHMTKGLTGHSVVSLIKDTKPIHEGFPGGSVVKNLFDNGEDAGSTSGSGRSPGVGNGNLLQYSYLGNPMDREVSWAAAHGVAKSQIELNN